MSRNIVLCFDGTNNEYDATNTNVVKIYQMLDLTRGDQIAYYQPGIGTMAPQGVWGRFKRWFIKELDLAIAWLLEEHVSAGYRFLMDYYQPGDQIFIFGFSRGAYSARALAAMLYKVGLLHGGNEELVPFAWDMLKHQFDPSIYEGFKKTFGRDLKIHFLGVWDTVSTVGWAWAPEHYQYTMNNPSVEVVRHAVSLDERRAYFVQNLWTNKPIHGQSTKQVWFPGVHCDVGGGYKESEAGLSKIALQWMVREATSAGLRVDNSVRDAIIPLHDSSSYVAPNEMAMMHQSLHGLWWLAECIPKRIKDPATNYQTKRWIVHCGRHRFVADGSHIHISVFDRKNKVPAYRPPNIPQQYVTEK